MDNTLKALHLRLDSTSKSLTKNAIAQLIAKILYSHDEPITLEQLERDIEKNLRTSISSDRVLEGINKLIEQEEIKYEKKKYLLTRSNRKSLDKRVAESNNRLERIVTNHLAPFHSEEKDVQEWFSDVTIEFFKSYSNDWISDICHTRSEKIRDKKESITKHLERRTHQNKTLDKRDKSELVKKFSDLIAMKSDPDIDAHLWEYGTSAFAANLLQSSVGADPISVAAFKDAKILLDTNVLMNVGLEASEYHETLIKLDDVFNSLQVKTGYLEITRLEYKTTIGNLSDEILKTVSKFDHHVIRETDDHFIQSALKRQCHNYEDFQRFCQEINSVPDTISDKQKIELFNDDTELDEIIKAAQSDERKKNELNEIFKAVTGHNKREAPLVHDVGLIAGAEHLRTKAKTVIISQEISVNKYSHTKPLVNNLPLSIRLDTLISMLAIDNGGTDVDPTDFSNLFASMIRSNLYPDTSTFKVTDLSKLLDTELQIEQLPSEEVIRIAQSMHENIARGMTDEEINLELNRQFQEVRMKFVDDLGEANDQLIYEKGQKEKHKNLAEKTGYALIKRIRKEEIRKFENRIIVSQLLWFFVLPLITTGATILGIYLYSGSIEENSFIDYLIGIGINFFVWVITSILVTKPRLIKRKESMILEIDDIVESRVKEETEI